MNSNIVSDTPQNGPDNFRPSAEHGQRVAAVLLWEAGIEIYNLPYGTNCGQISTNEVNPIPHESLAPLPKEVVDAFPPGFVGALAESIYRMSVRPVPEVSIAAALGLMAGICGKAWTTPDGGTGLNLYILLIARSATGKQALHSGINYFRDNLKFVPGADNFFSSSDSASAPALIKMLAERNSVVNALTEIGHILGAISSKRASSYEVALRGALNSAYDASSPNGKLGGRNYSNSDKDTGEVGSVAFSLVGETTPSMLDELLTEKIMADGFLSRFSMIEYLGPRQSKNAHIVEPSQAVTAHFKNLVVKALQSSPHTPVQWTEESRETFEEFDEFCDDRINATNNESRRQAWNRAGLSVLKIASLLAVGDDPNAPMITIDHIDWAHTFVMKNVKLFLNKLDSGDIGDGDDTRQKKVMAICRKVLVGDIKDKNPKLCDKGIISRRVLQTNTSRLSPFKNHPLKASKALTETIKALINSGALMEIDKYRAIEVYGEHGLCYRVLDIDDHS